MLTTTTAPCPPAEDLSWVATITWPAALVIVAIAAAGAVAVWAMFWALAKSR